MLLRTSPFRRRHVTHVDGAKVEDDGVTLVEQISLGGRHAAAVDTCTIAGDEGLPTESNIAEIKEMIIFRPVQNNELFVNLYWGCWWWWRQAVDHRIHLQLYICNQ